MRVKMKKVTALLVAAMTTLVLSGCLFGLLAGCQDHQQMEPTDENTTVEPFSSTTYPDDTTDTPTSISSTNQSDMPFTAFYSYLTSTSLSQSFTWREFQRFAVEYGFGMTEASIEGDGVPLAAYHIEHAIDYGFDAVFLFHYYVFDESMVPILTQARDAGLVVGVLTYDLNPEYQHLADFWINVDSFEGARQAGEYVSKSFPDGANVVEIGGQEGYDTQIKRSAGFRAGIAPNVTILGSMHCSDGWDAYETRSIMEEFINEFGDAIDVVYCHWDNGATGVLGALRTAGMHDVKVIGIEGSGRGYQQVKDGRQWLSVGISFTNMARQALYNTREILEGRSVPEISNIPWDIITAETIDDLPWPEW